MQLIKTLGLLGASFSILATAAPAPGGSCHVGAAWPDHHDCHNFFECAAGGIPVRKTCGPGTAYSPEIGVCDYEWKVRSCKHHSGEDKHKAHSWAHGAKEAEYDSDSQWSESKDKEAREGPRPSCHVGAAWPDHHDCHNFFECAAGGIPVRKTCGPGTAYSPEIGVCDYEWKVRSCKDKLKAHSWAHGAEEAASGSHSEWSESKDKKGHEEY
ncbi:hypothetical protein BDW75DRAFT_242927 [Aspergillus navahoensis]